MTRDKWLSTEVWSGNEASSLTLSFFNFKTEPGTRGSPNEHKRKLLLQSTDEKNLTVEFQQYRVLQ